MAVPRPLEFPRTGRRPLTVVRTNYPVLGLGLVAILLALLIGRDILFPPAATTAVGTQYYTVANGSVTTSVTATGTLVPAQAVNLGFKSGGQLTEVDVKSGDRVTKGQTLAKVDDTQLQVALQQAQASLAAAQVNLQVTLDGTALTQAQHAVTNAQQSVNDANTSLATAQATLATDQAQLATDQAATFYQNYVPVLQSLQATLAARQAQFPADGCTYPVSGTTCQGDLGAIVTGQNDISTLNSPAPAAAAYPLSYQSGYSCYSSAPTSPTAPCPSPVTNPQAINNTTVAYMAKANAAVTADNTKVNADGSAVSAAQKGVNAANQALQSAQDALNTQTTTRPATIAGQQAAISSAQAALTTAQQNLTNAILVAPFDGTISAVSAQVGDTVGAFSSTSQAQAPGSTAPLPSTSSATAGLMTLLNDRAYQAVVSFAESDASKVKSGMPGTVTFDAVSGLSIPVHVLAVAASSTISSNVVNYYVTLTLDNLNNQLRPGLTTNATVITASAQNVPIVPNSTITRLGGNTFVTTVDASGKRVRTPVQTGVAGSQSTQVVSGLQVGDRVVRPQLKTTSAAGANRALGGGGGTTILGGGGAGRG